MTTWNYIIGSEKDFEGAPEWATVRIGGKKLTLEYWGNGFVEGNKCTSCDGGGTQTRMYGIYDNGEIIAQRERVTSTNDDRLAHDMGLNPKYNRPCKGVTIDVYDVLQAFNVTNPALQHLVKKALAVGQRGHKDKMEDLRDILASAQRAIELDENDK